MKKDTIYIDIEDDITVIIDKVLGAKQPIAALVLPKRASVLQSTVNMKLLQKSAQQGRKRLVLISGDPIIRSIAGTVGIHVARTLQSKPEVPVAKESVPLEKTTNPAGDDANIEAVSSVAVTPVAAATAIDEDSIVLDNDAPEPVAAVPAKSKKDKKLAIPNFERFRLWFFGAIGLLVAGVLVALLMSLRLSSATVKITTQSKSELFSLEFTANTSQQSVDVDQKLIPAKIAEASENIAEKFPATGELDKGTKASGTATLTNCSDEDAVIPAGTVLSDGEFSFATDASVKVPASDFFSNGNCKNNGKKTVTVTATLNGDKYNLAARSYDVDKYPSIAAYGEQMSGGTSNIVKIISEADIQQARQKISDQKGDGAKDSLGTQLETDGYIALLDSFSTSIGDIVISAKVGDEIAEATATTTRTSSMGGIKQDQLDELVKAAAKDTVSEDGLIIVSTGIDENSLKVTKPGRPGEFLLRTSSEITMGPDLNEAQLKELIGGKKTGEVRSLLIERQGVTEVEADYSPFWVSKAPKDPESITIIIEGGDVASE